MEKVTDSGLFLTFAMLIIFLFFSSILLLKKKKSPNKPPGPWKLPFIGNLHQLAASSSLPWRDLNDLAKKYGPIFHLQFGEISAFVVSSSGLVKEVMRTHDLALAGRPATFATNILFHNQKDVAYSPYGEHWRQMRKICTLELLSNKKVGSFSSIRAQLVSHLISSLQTSLGTPFNLTDGVFSLTNNIVSKAAFGHNFKGQDELMPLLKYQMDSLGNYIVSDLFPSMWLLDHLSVTRNKLPKMQRKVDRVMDNIITEHKNKKMSRKEDEPKGREENLLDVLIRLQQDGELGYQVTDTIIKAIIFEMFLAGTDTASTTIEWAFSEMMKDPRVMEKAQAEVRLVVGENKKTFVDEGDCERLDYMKMVIKETLRLHPPIPVLVPRQCREVCEIDGYTIPIGTHILINVWAISRDPSLWDDAESFIPERFENNCISFNGTHFEFTPFGGGRRMCPGIPFALAVIEIVLANLLYHFDWELPGVTEPRDLDMEEVSGVVARRKEPLYVVPTKPIQPQ